MTELLRNEGLKRVRMRLITAVVFVFTLTCSGSFGMEDVVSSSGPGLTLLMILILPLVWSVPMAFVASELGSMVPEAGGLYRWIRRGMGEYWSFQAGWWWTLSLYVDSAVYVALALDYMQNQWGFDATTRALIGVGIVAVFTFINIRGLELTGWTLTIIQVGVMVPLLIFTVYGITKGTGSGFSPMMNEGESLLTSLNLGLAIMMWMYSGWESMSTLAGEIQNPQRVIPRALMIGTPLVIATYFVTVWASIRIANLGGPENYLNMWTGGGGEDFVELAKVVGGAFMGYLMLMSAILSNIGLYAGYLATGARPQFQMSRDRLLPRFIGITHKSWGTPWVAILMMGFVNAVLINFEFDALITIDVFLLMFPYVLIFLTVMIMRVREPNTPRSFSVPLPTWALGVWVAFPIAIAIIALFVNGMDWMIGGLAGILTGPIAYLIFKNIYKGTTDEALEGSTITPTGELTEFGATVEGVAGMKGQRYANLTAIAGIIAGAFAIGGAFYARSIDPVFGIPQFFGIYADFLSAVHVLVGLGIVMVIGGLLSFKWPSVGGVIVCVAAMIGLIYTYNRGQYRWTPYLYYWWGPWLFAWICGIFAGYAAYRNVPQSGEKLADARHAEGYGA